MESAVQMRKEGTVRLVEIKKVSRALSFGPPCAVRRASFCVLKLLTREDKADISFRIAERHAIGKGILMRGPSHVHAGRFVDPDARAVKRFMADSLHHAVQLRLCAAAWHLRYQTHYSRHIR